MDERLTIWAKMLLRLALVLLAMGLLPALAIKTIWPDIDALIPAMLLFSAAPLGAFILLISVILFLAALVRRKPAEPS
ncbi:MAG: hypothetical protein ABIQ30_01225 [Devosia sp.]